MPELYENIIGLLKKHAVSYREFEHAPILSYEDAQREQEKQGWSGVESKNVFVKGKDGNYYVYITTAGEKVDFKELKEFLGLKCAIASAEDVQEVIKCVPGCVAPFGFDEKVLIILDNNIFKFSDYLFSPGVTTKTVMLNVQDLKRVFADLPNKVLTLH